MAAITPELDRQVLLAQDPAVELSSDRTGLALERTRMSADQTLMSIIRTAVSLIGFGFTIHQAFRQFHKLSPAAVSDEAARNFGLALVLLGELLLAFGIFHNMMFGRQLNASRKRLYVLGLLHEDIRYRATSTFVVAVLLFLTGMAAIGGIIFRLKYFA